MEPYEYEIDWNKVKTVEDVINVLKIMDIQFTKSMIKENPLLQDYVVKIGGGN